MITMHTYKRGDETIELSKPLLLPEALTLDALFSAIVPYDVSEQARHKGPGRISGLASVRIPFEDYKLSKRGKGPGRKVLSYCDVGPYCSVNRGKDNSVTWDVTPTPAVIEAIRYNMLLSTGAISFGVVERDDGILVIAQYEQIIGSHWLAMLPKGALK